MNIDAKPYIPDGYSFIYGQEPEKVEPFLPERVSSLPDLGGKFILPPGTKIYKPNKDEFVVDKPQEVSISPISRDLQRARFVKARVLSSEEASLLPLNERVDDIRSVFIGGNTIGTIYGTEVRKAPTIVEREIV